MTSLSKEENVCATAYMYSVYLSVGIHLEEVMSLLENQSLLYFICPDIIKIRMKYVGFSFLHLQCENIQNPVTLKS